jgi:hypothetical protein
MRVNEERKELYVPDSVSLGDLAGFLNAFPEGEYKILIYGFDENTDLERNICIS